jgi:putative flippase GtrA
MAKLANFPVVNAALAGRNKMPLRSEVARFAFVGVNTAVDLAVLNTLIATSHRGRAGLVYSLFKAISFVVAVLNSYSMNSR